MLTVRNGKYGKSRLVPVHATTAGALRDYLRLRDRLCPDRRRPAVFISPAGTRLLYCNVHATWQKLAASAGPASPVAAAAAPAFMTCAIMRTAVLCALPWRFGC